MELTRRFMRLFYSLLYHSFAFTYDLVAWVVSFGRWKDWVFSVVPHLNGTHILELGHGPGHLQRLLLDRGLVPVAIDESTQMGQIAARRLGTRQKLTRGLTQALPFASESFDSLVSTFPSEYIFDPQTLTEAKRVLRTNGSFVVLPATFPSNSFLKWLYKITGESSMELTEILLTRFGEPFELAGFQTEVKLIDRSPNATLVIVVAKKLIST